MSETTRNPTPSVGTTLGGKYQLHRYLGGGGMGVVYEAIRDDGERVAIKLLLTVDFSTKSGADDLARFVREARVGDQIESPYVVRVLDAGTDRALKIPYLVMPLMSGLDLHELFEQACPLHPMVAVRIAYQMALALGAAHRRGIIHRDIKPANVFLEHATDGRVTVRVLDFGLAKPLLEQGRLTQTGSMLGTPHYMSPEHLADSKRVAPQADIWGLGLVLYNMLTGTIPFIQLRNYAKLAVAVRTQDVPPLQDYAPWVDGGLAAVVHGALIRDLRQRCARALDFADALKPYLCGDPVIDDYMLKECPKALRTEQAPRAVLPVKWAPCAPAAELPTLEREPGDPLLGELIGGKYRILRCIAVGTTSSVYEAEEQNGNRYAVKLINQAICSRGERARKRFVREARAAKQIDSDYVMRVVDADTDPAEGRPFIAMELLVGGDFDELLERHGPLEPEPVAGLALHACRGVAAAHRRGVVHRDLNPANIFLHRDPTGELVLKICNFGVAKSTTGPEGPIGGTKLTRSGGVVGSPAYMSPEQAESPQNVDERSDIWSLGVVLFRALAGKTPWGDRTAVGELLVAVCTEEVPPIQDVAPWVPLTLAMVVDRALKRDPDERFQSMDEFADALASFAPRVVMANELTSVSAADREKGKPRAMAAAAGVLLDTRISEPDVAPSSGTTRAEPKGRAVALARRKAAGGSDDLEERVIGERYQLEYKLGQGAMGAVWCATDGKLQRPVAIKLALRDVLDDDTEEGLARFEREATAVAALQSPHIVQVYDYGVEEGAPYLVMELLDGEELSRWLKRVGRFELEEAVQLVGQIAKALDTAHHKGIMHRDLKPGNIFVVRQHDEITIKVVDFGLAKVLDVQPGDQRLTRSGTLLGTPAYMSPEQAHGAKTVDHRTDLWSLAVIAYECLTGHLPFEAGGLGELLTMLTLEDPRPASEVMDGLPDGIDAFFTRALDKDQEARYQSAVNLVIDLAAICGVSFRTSQLPLAFDSESGRGPRAGLGRSTVRDDDSSTDAGEPVAGEPPSLGGNARSIQQEPPTHVRFRRRLWVAAALFVLTAGGVLALSLADRSTASSLGVQPSASAAAPTAVTGLVRTGPSEGKGPAASALPLARSAVPSPADPVASAVPSASAAASSLLAPPAPRARPPSAPPPTGLFENPW